VKPTPNGDFRRRNRTILSGGVAISTAEIGTEKNDEGRDSAGQGGSDSRDFGMSVRYFVGC
jgi:hypothetical protein